MHRLLSCHFRRTTLITILCIAVLVGIGMSRFMRFEFIFALFASGLMLFCLRYQRLATLLAIVLAGIAVGGWRGTVYMDRLAQYGPLYNQKITVVGIAVDDAAYGKQKQLTFDLKSARIDGRGPPLIGKIGVSGFGANTIFRGDTVQVTAKLRAGKGSKQGYMSFAELTDYPAKMGAIDVFRRKFAAGMASALPEPTASFAMGILIGQKTTLPDTVYEDLTHVGLVHIIAVSGYNLTIILRACLRLLGQRSKYQTFTVAVSLIAVFLLITGASASIVRASIVSGLSMMAWYYGRAFRPIVLIFLAAAGTGLASPLYPWSDIGWYLSFLAFYGVLILAPLVRRRFLKGWLEKSVLFGILLESLTAEIMTLPLVLYIFGQMSAVSLAANVIIAAFVPVAMLCSLVAGLMGMLLSPLAGWLAWPAMLVLTYMLEAARLLASIPHVFRENVYVTGIWMVGMYGLVITVNAVLYSQLKRNRAIIGVLTDDNPLLHTPGRGG